MSGLLNKALTSGNVQHIATVPPGAARSLLNIMVLNPLGSEATATVWATNQVDPSTVDLLDFNAKLPANGGKLLLECENCSAGEKIYVQGTPGMVVRVTNIDEAA